MRDFDELGLQLATQQANMFVEMNKALSGSSYSIIKTFMNGDESRRIDLDLVFDSSSIITTMLNQKSTSIGNEKINSDVMYWIGYIYRYWAYVYKTSSKQIYSIIQAKELEELYDAYHTLDPKIAIDRINESKNIKEKDSMLNIMKKIYLHNTEN